MPINKILLHAVYGTEIIFICWNSCFPDQWNGKFYFVMVTYFTGFVVVLDFSSLGYPDSLVGDYFVKESCTVF